MNVERNLSKDCYDDSCTTNEEIKKDVEQNGL